ncbi:hypothetical protein [Marinobacter gelidimuriae]|uniref:hypothetical protein n=1 Tax=Marinobacter gelidimuriae TaxID=2739064 RepID=UPI000371142B|nr:hypothetical protein [Marinobacter gelidimuriae]
MSQIGGKAFFMTKGNVVPKRHTIKEAEYFQTPDVRLPRRGVTVTYGHKGPGNINRAALRKAKADSLYLSFLDFRIEVGKWNPNKQSLSSLSECRFLNLPIRASAEVMDDINHYWNNWLSLDGEPDERFPRRPSNRMDLLDKLIDIPPYDQLNAIAYDVHTEFGIAKFMTIFNLDAIDYDSISVIPGGVTKINFELPD